MALFKKSKSKVKAPKDCLSMHGTLKIDDLSRMTLLRWEAQMQAYQSDILNRNIALNAFIKSVDPSGQISKQQQAITATQAELVRARTAYEDARGSIEKKLGIDLRDYSFDTESGVLHEIPVEKTPNEKKGK